MAKKERVEVTIGEITEIGKAGPVDEEGFRWVDFDNEGDKIEPFSGVTATLHNQWIESGDIKPVK